LSWDIVYCRQADGLVPVDEFLTGCPVKVRARLLAVLDDVVEAPPPQFSGGGR
jgi:NADH:ubiquinone oxidoreductase subunit B-like Fe-S oxidoreductase